MPGPASKRATFVPPRKIGKVTEGPILYFTLFSVNQFANSTLCIPPGP